MNEFEMWLQQRLTERRRVKSEKKSESFARAMGQKPEIAFSCVAAVWKYNV